MTIEELKKKDLIIYECLSGSHAYGLSTPESDIDIKGVFILPKDEFYGLNYVAQVSDEGNDTVYYELGRFVELLSKSNPNILELLYSPEDCIRIMHPLFKSLRQHSFLSKQCKESFGGYAMAQIKKARGLNKKILNPVEKERKSVLDFCYIAEGQGAVPVKVFLKQHGFKQHEFGLSRIAHMPEMYGLYRGSTEFKGIVKSDDANDVCLSTVPFDVEPVGLMSFNKSAYSAYCREYKAYWDWVEKRNDQRYNGTLGHGKGYDAKNMMHTIRLLNMCEEIGKSRTLKVRREDRDYLLRVKNGLYTYDDLLDTAEIKISRIEKCYRKTDLQELPDIDLLNMLLVTIRRELYNGRIGKL
ncbi:nucleotidyltransferase domain-containing protein [Fulvivirga ulvae]|uniref:nucleotidyltransferase domain-containing protein n=1 Tax=Fulvivirga ulvae TaxID=2904245 RepID=UPI001F269573|nr:nucleotidyltransferase domain-containing protein [Fulvivirga ulvae]UII31200.1 nucleotidyltransferase domain-containing protein [Fulvivirga ulvae]